MARWLFACLLPAGWLAASPAASAGELSGWQGFRVIHQEGNPAHMLVADLEGDGRDDIIVVNTRQSRLDIYHWLPKDQRTEPAKPDPERLNELPLAPEWKRTELALDELPQDAAVQDLDGDQKPELLIFTSPSQKVVVYRHDEGEKWKKSTSWDLLPGAPVGRRPMLVRALGGGKFELLVSFEQGIQSLHLESGTRPSWLSPREVHPRMDWKLCDLDGDGDLDLVEWTAQAKQTVRWYECHDGKLLPAQVLFEHSVLGFDVLAFPGRPAELLLLGGSQEGLLRGYTLARGAESELGRRDALPISGGNWCGLQVGDKPALVAVDPSQPRLRVEPLGEQGWLAEQTFPTISGIRAICAPQARPGTLLLWVKDSADLYQAQWEAGRLTYPKPLPQSAEVKERRILTLESLNGTAWWVQRVGSDLDLYVWRPADKEPAKTRFEGVGSKVEKVVWLSGQALLVQDQHAKGAKLVRLTDGNTSISEPAHLSKVDIGEFKVLVRGQEFRPDRLTDGVLQWLNDDVQPTDQIMLSEGQRLAAFVPLADGQAYALEQGGSFLHRLKPDQAGILREAESIKFSGGSSLALDPLLGLMLGEPDRLVRLSRGQPWELKQVDSLDSRIGRRSGVKESTIHRILTSDVTGDGVDDVLLCDDHRHQLTVLERQPEGLKSLLSWQVFEDQTYPYGGVQAGRTVAEPRVVLGLNADGDPFRDLALLCHDRLLIYLGRETP